MNYFNLARLNLFQVEGSDIAVPNDVHSSRLNEQRIGSLDQIPPDMSGFMERVGRVPQPKIGDPLTPILVQLHKPLQISGWFMVGEHATGESLDEIYAYASAMLIRAAVVPRADIGAYLKNPKLDNSGYELQLGSNVLRPGLQPIHFLGYRRRDNTYHRLRDPLYVYGHSP